MAGWLAGRLGGWVVGKSDFNENPVVSLDLDLDFGLRLRVCQKRHVRIIPFREKSVVSEAGINRVNGSMCTGGATWHHHLYFFTWCCHKLVNCSLV